MQIHLNATVIKVCSEFWLARYSGLTPKCDELIQDAKEVYDSIGSVEGSAVSFHTILQPLLDIDRDSFTRGLVLQVFIFYNFPFP